AGEKFKQVLSAAHSGKLKAQVKLGNYFLKRKEYRKAGNWYLKAARKDSAYAQFRLGQLFERGLLGANNKKKAHGWFQKSSELGYQKAIDKLYALTYQKRGKKQASDSRKSSTERKKKLISAALSPVQMLMSPPGSEDAIAMAFIALKKGNLDKGLNYLRDVANKNYVSNRKAVAHSTLGIIFLYGKFPGLKNFPEARDPVEAEYWLEKGAALNGVFCQYLLVQKYLRDENFSKVLYWLYRIFECADAGDQKYLGAAYLTLGKMHILGQGVVKDPETGYSYIEKAGSLGNQEAVKIISDFSKRMAGK
ncbi:hypothetical protein ACFL35_20820, partial [Candidatus Riflebacteria bacterium]